MLKTKLVYFWEVVKKRGTFISFTFYICIFFNCLYMFITRKKQHIYTHGAF